MSIPVSAIRAQVTSMAQAALTLKPKCQATAADNRAVASSTNG